MVLVDALRDAGRDLTRDKFISALENVHEKNIGLGPDLKLGFSPTDHIHLALAFGVYSPESP